MATREEKVIYLEAYIERIDINGIQYLLQHPNSYTHLKLPKKAYIGYDLMRELLLNFGDRILLDNKDDVDRLDDVLMTAVNRRDLVLFKRLSPMGYLAMDKKSKKGLMHVAKYLSEETMY